MSSGSKEEFSITETLPVGNLAIDASAGTGKTYTLADLAARSIAQGTLASELLVVTFTRAATGELQWRVRERLAQCAIALRQDVAPAAGDSLLAFLWVSDRAVALARIERAIGDFDAATITTIHGFASLVLSSLGSTAGTDLDATFADDGPELVDSVCADVLAAEAARGASAADLPPLSRLKKGATALCSVSDTVLFPDPDDGSAPLEDRMLSRLVSRARDEVEARRRSAGTLSYDDLLSEVRRALQGSGANAVAQTLRDRYQLSLIDEFQDTDAVQWEIFSTLFGAGVAGSSLVLVGDPKQAIYSFRGADVHTFLKAVRGSNRRTLKTNWRADGTVLKSLQTLFEDVTFGDPEITFLPSVAAPGHDHLRMQRNDGSPMPALSLRLALGKELKRNAKSGAIAADDASRAIYRDLVARIRGLLTGARLPEAGADGATRSVAPSDIAVLVKTGAEAQEVQTALLDQGVPAVLARGESVLLSEAAEQWRGLLWAVERPSDPKRARTLALSWFGGWSAQEVGEASDAAIAALQEQIMRWGETLTRHGVTAFVRQVWTESGVPSRVLSLSNGDRAMTDLQHVGELLQAAAPSLRSSVAGLLATLKEPDVEDELDDQGAVTARRIESEANAVQVMTVWVAKGLEFDIVCLPTMWRPSLLRSVIYQDPATGFRMLDVTQNSGKAAKGRRKLAIDEALGEQLRLLYVALTRAKHHTSVWWSHGENSESSALAHVLFARSNGLINQAQFDQARVVLPPHEDTMDVLAPLLDRSGGSISAQMHGDGTLPGSRWESSTAKRAMPMLSLATLGAPPDRTKHRWSFTALTSGEWERHGDPYDQSLSDSGASDEASAVTDAVEDGPDTAVLSLPAMALLPAGADFGTLVHAVLEKVDFTADDLPAALRQEVDRQLRRSAVDLTPLGSDGGTDGRALLTSALASAIDAPLTPSLRLRDLDGASRINEMSFELRLGEAGETATMHQLGRLLETHLPSDDPFHGWARALATRPSSPTLAGHLTGSIDLVFRESTAQGLPRFYVADYKTNRLSRRGELPKPDDYGPAHLIDAMIEHHYPLQALLYSVALHRYLRWRLPDYAPTRHLGGALYLFVRGMAPSDTAGQGGVFHWNPPATLVTAASDLLDGSLASGRSA